MTDRPDKFPEWATLNIIDPVFKTDNVVEPPAAYKASGFKPCEQVPNNWVNWLFRLINTWIHYFDERVAALQANNIESYTKAEVTNVLAVSLGVGKIIYVSDATGGGVPAFSDGVTWRRVTDRTIID